MKRVVLALALSATVVTTNLQALIVADSLRDTADSHAHDAKIGFILSISGMAGATAFGIVASCMGASSESSTPKAAWLPRILSAAAGVVGFVGWVYLPADDAEATTPVTRLSRMQQHHVRHAIQQGKLSITEEQFTEYLSNQDQFILGLEATDSISDEAERMAALESQFGVSSEMQRTGAMVMVATHPQAFAL